jgi:predicted alpha/beta-hydrolase family hydrolase
MTSQAQALQPLSNVQGLVFFGFSLHQAGKPSIERAHHLADVRVPMLFIQGTRDNLAEPVLIERVVKTLGDGASLHEIVGADHSLHVSLKSGRRDADVLNEALDRLLAWLTSIAATGRVPPKNLTSCAVKRCVAFVA